MKKIYFLLFISPLFILNSLHAQGNCEVFGLYSQAIPYPAFSEKGFGGGINLLGRSIPLTGKENLHPVLFQFGGGIYVSELGNKKFRDIPLEAPQTGNATVNFYNCVIGGNFFFRFSAPNSMTGRKPYLDFTGGLRSISSNMSVSPNAVMAGYENKTSSSLYTAGGWSRGIGVGMQLKLSDDVNFDMELLWNYSTHTKNIIDLKSATRTTDGIYYDTKMSPNSVVMLKVGFSFQTENSRGHSGCGCHNNSYHSSSHISSGGGHANSAHVSTGHSGGGHPSIAR